jgi:peptidoglycan/LPS O-acetylase OafA/YrhL
VSAILFSEYKTKGTINPIRFLIRRQFRIYPLFLAVLVLHIIYYSYKGVTLSFERILPELLFFQNYRPGIMGISWSLAVEEHFYLLLSAGFFILLQLKRLDKKSYLPISCLFIGASCLLLRIFSFWQTGDSQSTNYFFYTHFRIDALAFGVLISWLRIFSPIWLNDFTQKYKYLLTCLFPVLLAPVFIWQVTAVPIITFGLTSNYLGFGIMLLLLTTYANNINRFIQKIYLANLYRVIAWVGIYSYGIYLIHLKAGPSLSNLLKTQLLPALPESLIIFINFLFSIGCGYLLSILIERPFLRLRDKYFPSR